MNPRRFAFGSCLLVGNGFMTLGFQLIMWYYVAKFIGIRQWVWVGFAICSVLAHIGGQMATKEYKKLMEQQGSLSQS